MNRTAFVCKLLRFLHLDQWVVQHDSGLLIVSTDRCISFSNVLNLLSVLQSSPSILTAGTWSRWRYCLVQGRRRRKMRISFARINARIKQSLISYPCSHVRCVVGISWKSPRESYALFGSAKLMNNKNKTNDVIRTSVNSSCPSKVLSGKGKRIR